MHHRGHGVDGNEKRQSCDRKMDRILRADHVQQHLGGSSPRIRHIDVRVGPVASDHIGQHEHLGGHVCVRIHRYRNLHVRADQGADTLQQFAFSVVDMLRDHRAVEIKIDRVESGGFDRFNDLAGDPFVGLGSHMRRSTCASPDDRDYRVTQRFHVADEAADRNIDLKQLLDILTTRHAGKVFATNEAVVAIVGANVLVSCRKPVTRIFMESFPFHAARLSRAASHRLAAAARASPR